METPLSKGWRGMHLDKYDDSTDRDEHLANYLTQVNLFSNEDVLTLPPYLYDTGQLAARGEGIPSFLCGSVLEHFHKTMIYEQGPQATSRWKK
ncbi:hypothetical protein CR513_44520, partial [Mucuna pruriens]